MTRNGPSIWTTDVSSSPAARAGLPALLREDLAIQSWDAGPTTANGGLIRDDVPRPSGPDVITAVMATEPIAIETALARWDAAGLVMIGGNRKVAYLLASDRPLALLSVETEATPLIAAVHAVAAGLSVVDPAMLHPERGILAAVAGTGVPDPTEVLTPREHQVLALVAAGLPNKTIARELGISEHTAKFHVGSLLAKLGAASRTEAVTLAARRGILII